MSVAAEAGRRIKTPPAYLKQTKQNLRRRKISLKNREVESARGKLVRDMMKNMMDSAMGHKIQTGEYRKDPKEPAWIYPPDYEYEIVECPILRWNISGLPVFVPEE